MFLHTKPRYSINDLLILFSIGRARLYSDIQMQKLKTYKVGKRRFASPQAVDGYIQLCENEAQA